MTEEASQSTAKKLETLMLTTMTQLSTSSCQDNSTTSRPESVITTSNSKQFNMSAKVAQKSSNGKTIVMGSAQQSPHDSIKVRTKISYETTQFSGVKQVQLELKLNNMSERKIPNFDQSCGSPPMMREPQSFKPPTTRNSNHHVRKLSQNNSKAPF